MKKLLALAFVLALSACDNGTSPSTDSSSSSANASSAVGSSSSVVKAAPAARLTMDVNQPLKRITVGGISNKIISRSVDTSSEVASETVVIDLGDSLKKENYNINYYLFSTGSPVRVDSVVVDDSLSFISKKMEGSILTNSIGFTGDGIMPFTMINDTLTVAGIKHTRFRAGAIDDTIRVTVYGTDSTGARSTLLMKLAFRQHAYGTVYKFIPSTTGGKDNLQLLKSLMLPGSTWTCGRIDANGTVLADTTISTDIGDLTNSPVKYINCWTSNRDYSSPFWVESYSSIL